MKLAELFEDLRQSPSKRDFYDTIDTLDKIQPKSGMKKINGVATYGRVYDMPKEVNSVLKVARHPGSKEEEDGYYSFARRVMNMDNPYFPKIDELNKKHVGPDGEPFFTVKMEKLTPVHQLSKEEVQAVMSRIVQRPFEDAEMEKLMRATVHAANRAKGNAWALALATFLERAVEQHKYLDMIKDGELIQAIKVLRVFWSNFHYLDIHDENIMCRRTPYGPQIVFTDPFSIINKPKEPEKQAMFKPK